MVSRNVHVEYLTDLHRYREFSPHLNERESAMQHLHTYDEDAWMEIQGSQYDPLQTDIPMAQFYSHVKMLLSS